ncbi:MAG TPA: S9 family peptidase [Thermoanaerobaculia bacterium]|nr:S9 family peptidase [Thermoanaerobaculia bacterium]
MRFSKNALLTAIAVVALACSTTAPAPEPSAPEIPLYTIEQFLDTDNYRGASFSPDGRKILVASDLSGIYNAYAIPVAGGDPVTLTRSTTDSIFTEAYFPHDERFLYRSDEGGNELDHLYVRELDGSVRDLTPGAKLKAGFLDWSGDRRSFHAITNERDPRFFDVYAYDAASYEREMLFRNDEGYDGFTISRDGRWLAMTRTIDNANTDLVLHDLRSGSTRVASPAHEGDANFTPQEFGPDDRSLYYVSDAGSEFAYLARLDVETGETAVILDPPWDVMYAEVSADGRYLVAGINDDGRTELRILELDGYSPVRLPPLPEADITGVEFASDGGRMAFYASSSRMPRDLFVAPVRGGEPRRLTRSLNPAIDPDALVEGEVVRFASFDGVTIPGILYRPKQASAADPAPALVWVHGGPGGQSRLGYSALIQYLVNHGYAIHAINNRGSSGYGKTFFHMDDRAHGEGDLDDVVASRGMLAGREWIDGDRVGVIGGSYGGFMVLAAMAFRPDAFEVGVDIFGVSNWVRTLQSIPPWWESFRAYLVKEMGDFEDTEYLESISPLFHADRIRRPLIVLQGANDPRVLKVESDEIVEAVRANGVPVEYVVFDDEGHGFRKKENQERGYRAILEFLDEHLK